MVKHPAGARFTTMTTGLRFVTVEFDTCSSSPELIGHVFVLVGEEILGTAKTYPNPGLCSGESSVTV